MSPSAHIVKRRVKRGLVYQVRFRWRPGDSTAHYFATAYTRKDAEVIRAWVLTEIAHGRFPDPEVYFAEPTPQRTLVELHDDYIKSRRHEVGPAAQKQYRQALAKYGRLGAMDPNAITVADVRVWVGGMLDEGRKPGTVRAYLSVLRQVLDLADLTHPNPARDARVKVGSRHKEEPEPDPPSFAHHTAMLAEIAPKHAGLLLFLERTGFRIGEALAITWGDVDWRDDLLRVTGGKTLAARRWVPLLPVVREALEAVPADDRSPKRTIFPAETTENSMRSAMRLATQKAGVPTYTPHDLRHRYTSLLVMAGVPPPLVSKIVGHTKVGVTLETYSHVLMDEPDDRLMELRRAAFTVPAARGIGVGGTVEVVE